MPVGKLSAVEHNKLPGESACPTYIRRLEQLDAIARQALGIICRPAEWAIRLSTRGCAASLITRRSVVSLELRYAYGRRTAR
jgi:hypothetical protein